MPHFLLSFQQNPMHNNKSKLHTGDKMSAKNILVIDDDKTLHDIVEKTLNEYGFKALRAYDGKEGLSAAQKENVDAILLDRQMPGLNGNDVLKTLKNKDETANIPVLMLTSDNAIIDVAESLELGANDYIVKPFDNENLIIRLKNVLR